MESALNLLKLTDRYERKARLLPALLSCLAGVPIFAALSPSILGWVKTLSIGGVFVAVGAVGLSYAASAAGRHFERKLWPRWPYDAPTNCWLHPDDTHCSREQKQHWYEAVKHLVELDIHNVAAQGDRKELERVINDAVRALRHQFRLTNVDGLLAIHNEDYGFARNLGGLRLFWLPAAVMSTLVTWAAYFSTETGLIWGIVASVVLVITLALLYILPGYVRQRAERYADSFFGTLTALYQESQKKHLSSRGDHESR